MDDQKEEKSEIPWKDIALITGSILIGIGIGYVIFTKYDMPNIENNLNANPIIKPIINNINSNMNGPMRKVVQCLETGEIWASVFDAAQANDTTSSVISKVINGHTDSFNGKHFAVIGMGAY